MACAAKKLNFYLYFILIHLSVTTGVLPVSCMKRVSVTLERGLRKQVQGDRKELQQREELGV